MKIQVNWLHAAISLACCAAISALVAYFSRLDFLPLLGLMVVAFAVNGLIVSRSEAPPERKDDASSSGE